MVKHIILWTLKDEYTEAQKKEIRAGIKEGLEGLKGQIPACLIFQCAQIIFRHLP